jgi:hypothetical protein
MSRMPSSAYRAKRRPSSQAGLGLTAAGAGVALVCVPITCVWFLMRADGGATAADAAALAQSKALMTQMASIRPPVVQATAPPPVAAPETTAALAPAPATFDLASADSRAVDLSRPRVGQAELFDPPETGSIPSAAFQKETPAAAPSRFAALTPPAAATADDVAPLPVPTPAPRPAAAVVKDVPRAVAEKPKPARKPVQTASLATPPAAEFRAPPSPSPVVNQKLARSKALTNPAVVRLFEKIRGRPQEEQLALGYAPAESSLFGDNNSFTPAVTGPIDQYTAVYDIVGATIHMPDGTKLEAHSGLGAMRDDPKHANVRMQGVTPPHIYDLKLRESLFHGVRALRMTPVQGEKGIFGRNGILAHTYMLGPRGDSNGCMSVKDYNAFLQAFLRGEVKRVAVVARLD